MSGMIGGMTTGGLVTWGDGEPTATTHPGPVPRGALHYAEWPLRWQCTHAYAAGDWFPGAWRQIAVVRAAPVVANRSRPVTTRNFDDWCSDPRDVTFEEYMSEEATP